MSRYIDAYEVKRQIQKATEGQNDVMKVFLNAMYRIDKIPTADVRENVRGEWQKVDEQPYFRKHFHKVCCSVCRKQGYDYWNFCPNCGADMRGDKS